MKKIRIRRIIVRETETTVLKMSGAEASAAENEPHVCPLCHSPIQPKQIAAPQTNKFLLQEEDDSKKS